MAHFFSITIGSADLPYDELFYKFLLFRNAQYCTTFGRFHWFLLFCLFFFLLRVTYLLLGFTGGLFVITLMSSEWIVHNDSRVLLRSLSKFRSRALVTWTLIRHMVIKVSLKVGLY